MLELVLTMFCLIASFVFTSKKMKIKSIAQAVLAVVLAVLVFFLMPNAPLSHFIEPSSLEIMQEILTEISSIGVSIISIILYAIIFLTILSFIEIIGFVKERIVKKEEISNKVFEEKFYITEKNTFFEQKIYLLFCRLLD